LSLLIHRNLFYNHHTEFCTFPDNIVFQKCMRFDSWMESLKLKLLHKQMLWSVVYTIAKAAFQYHFAFPSYLKTNKVFKKRFEIGTKILNWSIVKILKYRYICSRYKNANLLSLRDTNIKKHLKRIVDLNSVSILCWWLCLILYSTKWVNNEK